MGTETLEMAQLERMTFEELHRRVADPHVDLWTLEKILDHVRECVAANEVAPDSAVPDEVKAALYKLELLRAAVLARLPQVAERDGTFLDQERPDEERLRDLPTGKLIEMKARAQRHADENERLWPAVAELQLQAANDYDRELRRREQAHETSQGFPASDVYSEGLRLIAVAEIHRDRMLLEVGDTDLRVQRGNAAAFAGVEANISTRIDCLRAFGFVEHARLLEQSAAHVLGAVVLEQDVLEKLQPGELDPRD